MEMLVPGAFVGAIIVIGGGLYWYMNQQRQQKADAARTQPMMVRAIAQSRVEQAPSEPIPSAPDGTGDAGQKPAKRENRLTQLHLFDAGHAPKWRVEIVRLIWSAQPRQHLEDRNRLLGENIE